ncbi:hypothetical protein MiYa_01539 [Microcystis aeruginosa NIES-2519]|jgi:hypothetical protein|uniref:Uncharacterized protein n=1 Tax=Microcystis aeruginosa NIES-2519 TaxID=2303981 RepID=A0A5A5R9Y5_MICAE|nr:hypothetical protein MiYa_01539 [Microcystis aeruginosa NIES-2519]
MIWFGLILAVLFLISLSLLLIRAIGELSKCGETGENFPYRKHHPRRFR